MKKVVSRQSSVVSLVIVTLLLITYYLLLITPAFASMSGVQIPSQNPLDRLKTSGYNFEWVKYQYRWDADQPVETWVKEAKQRGYKVLLSVTKRRGDQNYSDFQEFMKNLSSRFKGQVGAYEIWNEPNLKDEWSGWGEINPEEYVKLLSFGAAGVREGDPGAKVISAGLAPLSGDYDDLKFFSEFISAGGLNYIDAIGWHANIVKNIPPSDADQEGFQRVKAASEKGKPIWITEFGWNKARAGINQETQAKYIKEAFEIAPTLGNIENMIVWNFGFSKENPDPDFPNWDIEGSNLNLPGVTPGNGSENTKSQSKSTSEEQAISNLNQGLLPKEAIKSNPSVKPSLWDYITQTFKNFLSPLQFFAKSESIHQAYLPNELRPEYKEIETKKKQASDTPVLGITTSSPLEALTNLLGGSTGFYGAILPKEVQGQDIKGSEEAFEKAYFPENIKPITRH